MNLLRFLGRHWESGVQLAVTAWFAYIARNFQITLAVHGTRLEAHREAVRRSLVLWWLQREDPGEMDTRNEMIRWLAVNEVFLSPRAAEAFKAVERWKTLLFSTDSMTARDAYKEADVAMNTLKRELLRFRKLTIREAVIEGWRQLRKRRRR